MELNRSFELNEDTIKPLIRRKATKEEIEKFEKGKTTYIKEE